VFLEFAWYKVLLEITGLMKVAKTSANYLLRKRRKGIVPVLTGKTSDNETE
jgi:hypothetical protein